MTRIKRGLISHKRHKSIFYFSKGYIGRRKNVFKISKQSIMKSFIYSYRDRKVKKRIFKSFWISSINFYLKNYNFNYSFFIKCLSFYKIYLNKKSIFLLFKNSFNFVKLFSIIFFYYYYKF